MILGICAFRVTAEQTAKQYDVDHNLFGFGDLP
jgi:hypothetical protein